MKTQLALAAGLATLLAAPSVFPCGAPFGSGINVDPKQDIIVVHKDGIETYVFQPTFCGATSNFGLILPVPSKLTALPDLSNQQAFTTVADLSKPLEATSRVCTDGRNGVGGSAGGMADAGGATVVVSGRVGFLEFVQLKADTEASFTDWLNANGYPYSPAASSVFSYYVQKGWYFVAFKISQGAMPDGGSSTICKALGPIKMSFPTDVPVVPSRMASAASPPTTYYSSSFSWRIFGITPGDKQLSFADGASYTRVLGYSGALTADNVTALAGLAQAGDRLSKLTLTFSYGATDPDIGLALAPASDFRETHWSTVYVNCPEAGPIDAVPVVAPDAAVSTDGAARLPRDAESPPDAGLVALPDAGGEPDAPRVVTVDAGVSVVPDASVKPEAQPVLAKADAASSPITIDAPGSNTSSGGGCSVAGGSTSNGFFALLLLGLVGWVRKRRIGV